MSNFTKEYKPISTPGISTKYPETQESGPFAPICSSSFSTVNINEYSYIFLGMSLDSTLEISNRGMTIPVNGSSWKVWLEVFFRNKTPITANFNFNTEWWENYPQTQEYGASEGFAKTPSNQLALRVPVLTIDSLSNFGGDGFIFNFNGSLTKIKRHINNDLILFQSCDGFMFLPSAFSKPD